MKTKYHILIDYNNEGLSFHDDGHDSLNKAVKMAQANAYGSKFYIVKIINWKATEK